MGGQLRFLQASDLLLDTPIAGVGSSDGMLADAETQRLKGLLANARYRAAEKLFQAAIDEQVDFVLLAGNVLGPLLPGSRAPWFIAEQLRKLEQARIPVIWSETSAPSFCTGLSLPRNVQILTDATRQREVFLRRKQGTVRVVRGTALVDPLAADFTIAIADHQDICTKPLADRLGRIDYIASVGMARAINNRVASSGPLQGQGFHQSGEHGCLLVTSLETACETRFLPLDSVRWCHESVSVNSATTWESLERAMLNRQQELASQSGVDLAVVQWDLAGYGPLWNRILNTAEQNSLLSTLQQRFHSGQSILRVTSLKLTPDQTQIADWRSASQMSHVVAGLDSWRNLSATTFDVPAVTGVHDHVPASARVLSKEAYRNNIEGNTLCWAAQELISSQPVQTRAA